MRIYVISKGRPQSVPVMKQFLGELFAVWVVPENEMHLYNEAGAAFCLPDGGGLVQARNIALEDAFTLGLPCVQLSDDLKALNQFVSKMVDSTQKHPLTMEEALQDMRNFLKLDGRAKMAGVAPTDNTFYASTSPKLKSFIVGDMIMVLPTELRFDEQFRLKEDYDYTCQHIKTYGRVLRLDWILASFRHRSNKGGAVDDRTAELEQDMIRRLKEKWPGWIHDNPRRENEVLLRINKTTTEVWS
jgi:hypothetical protein